MGRHTAGHSTYILAVDGQDQPPAHVWFRCLDVTHAPREYENVYSSRSEVAWAQWGRLQGMSDMDRKHKAR